MEIKSEYKGIIMNANKIEVLQWWYGSREYQQGIMLLARFSRNKVLVHTLMKPGKERFGGRAKLEYELPKAVGLDFRKMPPLPEGIVPPTINVFQQKKVGVNTPEIVVTKEQENAIKRHLPLVSNKPLDQYPKVIRRLKYEYSSMYTQRSILHKNMRNIPEDNSPKNMTARGNLLGEIQKLSVEMDRLYAFIGEYETNGTIPAEDTVWPPNKSNPPTVLPDDVIGLRKIKKNLQTLNTKERNRLLYGSTKKGKNKNPMPRGPMRIKYEMKISNREKQINAIQLKIVQLQNAN